MSKYRAKPTVIGGIRFDSKREAAYYTELKMRVIAGEILGFLRQVPIHLPGNIIYRADFLVYYPNGQSEIHEVKGHETRVWKMKKKLCAQFYPWLTIKVIK